MLVVGFFVFGFDNDDKRVFEMTESAIKKMDIDDICLYILTPYPGTQFYETFRKEGRLLAKDRSNYGWANAVFVPKLMTPEELEEGVQQTYERLHSYFKAKAPLKILSRLPVFMRHPHILRLVIKALFRRVDVSKQLR